MPGYTQHYGWPYPVKGDAPDAPAQIRGLTEAIEPDVAGIDNRVAGIDTRLTTAETTLSGLDQLAGTELDHGTASVSFSSKISHTQAVVFSTPFADVPFVDCTISSGAGPTARWGARAFNVTASGFTLFVFSGDDTGSAQTWSNVPVRWIAVYKP